MERKKGKIVSFSPLHGYGFIVDTENEFIFFHKKDWRGKELPMKNQEVTFTKEVTEKGARAKGVMLWKVSKE